MTTYQALTIKSEGILSAIMGDCGVSEPFLPEKTDQSKVKVSGFKCLWDTGATNSVINKRVIEDLNLKPIGKTKAYNANGECEVNIYMVNIFLPNKVGITFVNVTEGVLNGFDVLIGMDIIAHGDFSITNYNHKTTFSFRVPSLREVDYVDEHNKLNAHASSGKKIGPNDQCPCGSGLKYKRCHGKRI